MGANGSWTCQERREHGWFGTETCGGDCAGGCEPGVPGTFCGRLAAVVLGAVEAQPRPAARRALAGMTGRTIKTLHQAMLSWPGKGAEAARATTPGATRPGRAASAAMAFSPSSSDPPTFATYCTAAPAPAGR